MENISQSPLHLELEEKLDSSSEQAKMKRKRNSFSRRGMGKRNWVELPKDIISLIFRKIGAIEILLRAQFVCCQWRKLSREPHIWHSIDMRNKLNLFMDGYDLEKWAREAIDRSCGQLVEFSAGNFVTDDLLKYITDKSSRLRCLRLVSCLYVTDTGLIEMSKNLPLLEELELSPCSRTEVIEAIGNACPKLKFLWLNNRRFRSGSLPNDEKALAVARSMSQLRYLNLFGDVLTDTGLQAILDGCSHLESLDLRQCFNLNLEKDLLKRCVDNVRKLRFPKDSTDDYRFLFESDDQSFDNDYYQFFCWNHF